MTWRKALGLLPRLPAVAVPGIGRVPGGRVGILAALAGLVLLVASPLAIAAGTLEQSKTAAWMDKRFELFRGLCLKTAPTFATFAATARRLGFSQGNMGPTRRLVYRDTEVVASLLPLDGGGCSCFLTFGTGSPDVAVIRLAEKMLTWYPSFKATRSPGSLGTLRVGGRALDLRVSRVINFNVPWIGLDVRRPGRCGS